MAVNFIILEKLFSSVCKVLRTKFKMNKIKTGKFTRQFRVKSLLDVL